MIEVTRLNHTGVVINSDLIEQIETTPDTVITMTTGQKMVVLETMDVIVERVKDFRRSLFNPGTPRGVTSPRVRPNPFAG